MERKEHNCEEFKELKKPIDGRNEGYCFYEDWDIYKDEDGCWMITANGEYSIEIKFCPFCGEKL